MNRRVVTLALLQQAFAAATLAWAPAVLAQRVAQPITRPRPGRPPMRPGRLDPSGVSYGPAAGIFTVVSVYARDNKLRVRDDAGNSADVYVSERLFDVEALQAGDLVMLDFFVQDDNQDRLEAASIEKLDPGR
jgi:hypothetical protein